MVLDSPLQRLTNGARDNYIVFNAPEPGTVWRRINANPIPKEDFVLRIPSQTISCPINVIQPQGQAPNAPEITGDTYCKVGVTHQYNIVGTDPDTDPEHSAIRYAIDWNNDGIVNQLVPSSGYVESGTLLRVSRVWKTPGVKTFRVRTEDKQGLFSPWTTFTTDECLDSDDQSSLYDRHTYGNFPDGSLNFSFDRGITNNVCVGSWDAAYVADCTLYRNNEKVDDIPESGQIEFLPGTYRIDCRQLNDGAILSKTLRCLFNPDVREL
jgi:hypothetical protein